MSLFGERLHVITEEDPAAAIKQTTERLEANGMHVISATEERFSLEDVFICHRGEGSPAGQTGNR